MRGARIAALLALLLAGPAGAQEFDAVLSNAIVRVDRIAADAPLVEREFLTDFLTDTLFVDVVMTPPGADVLLANCSGFDLTNFIFSKGGSVQRLTLEEPTDRALPLGLEPGVHFKVVLPDPGDRQCFQIRYTQTPGVTEDVAAVATIRSASANRAALNAIPRAPVVSQPVALTLAWFFQDSPFTAADASGTVEIRQPDGRASFLALRDDGQGADGEAGDGLWSASFTPRQTGVHRVVARASTFSSSATAEALTEFEALPAPLAIFGPIVLTPIDADGNGLFESVEASVSVEAAEAGTYDVALTATGEAPRDRLETVRVALATGPATVTIPFRARDFRLLKEGPYLFGPMEAQRVAEDGTRPAGFLNAAAELDLRLADLQLPPITLYGALHDRATNQIRLWDPGVLYTVDPTTAEATPTAEVDPRYLVPNGGATFLRGKLYLSNVHLDPEVSPSPVAIGVMDTTSGEITPLVEQGVVSAFANWNGLAGDEAAGLLYTMTGFFSSAQKLLAIDLDGNITTVRDGTTIVPDGLAFDDANGILYAVDSRTNSLYAVDPTTGDETLVGPTGITLPRGHNLGLAYDEACRVLYASLGAGAAADSDRSKPDLLYRADTETGAFTLLGETAFLPALAWGAEGFDGSAFECPSPLPADLTLEVAPRVDSGPLGGTANLVATLAEIRDGAPLPRAGQAVRVEVVAGPNAGAGVEADTDAEGRISFDYPGASTIGADEIRVSAANDDGSEISETAIRFWDRDCNDNGAPDTCEYDCLAFDRRCSAFPACGALGAESDGIVDACLQPRLCDVNDDGAVDRTDVDAIVAGRNLPSEGEGDPRDADRDGTVTHADARLCTLECDLPRCGAPAPSACGLGAELAPLLAGLQWLRARRRRARAARGGNR